MLRICMPYVIKYILPSFMYFIFISILVPLISGGGHLPNTGPLVMVHESDGLARVCVKLSGITNPSPSMPVNFTFTPMENEGATHPAQGIVCVHVFTIIKCPHFFINYSFCLCAI